MSTRSWAAAVPDDPAGAKKALLEALGSDSSRESVIGFMQPADEERDPAPYAIKQRAAADALRSDSEVRQAVSRYGRILQWRLNEAAHAQQQ